MDRKAEDMSELFRPFHTLLRKIRWAVKEDGGGEEGGRGRGEMGRGGEGKAMEGGVLKSVFVFLSLRRGRQLVTRPLLLKPVVLTPCCWS